MILDNADDLNLFIPKADEAPLASYLPKTSNGKILITSRNLNVAERLTGSYKAIKQVLPMDSAEALQLFQNKMDSGFDESAAVHLIRALGFIPLAVNQAVAYINRRRVSIHSYMTRFQDGKMRSSLLNHDAGDIRRYESVSNAVNVTWRMTFEEICQERPTAANLLSLMSFFHPQNIPLYVLSGYSEAAMSYKNRDNENVALEDDLDVLLAYCLINMSVPGFCEMHSLVQFCTRMWLLNLSNLTRWEKLFLRLVTKYFPSGDFETWATCQTLLPLIEMVLEQQPLDEADILQWSLLLTNAAWYTAMIGDYVKAERLYQKAVEVRKRLLGADDPSTLTSASNLALMYTNQGRWEEAEKLNRQVMEMRKIKLGVDHPDTLTNMNNLAVINIGQARWEDAEKLSMQVMEMRRTKLGTDHPDTLITMSNLATTYMYQDRWEEAKNVNMQVMEIRKSKLGEDHPETLGSMDYLASTYMNLDLLEEAEKLLARIMEIRKTKFLEDHPNILRSMGSLVFMSIKQGRWQEAEALNVQVWELRKNKLRQDHPDTLTSMSSLASLYAQQDRWQEAEALNVQLWEVRKNKLGEDHPDAMASMHRLGWNFRRLGRVDEALALMRSCVSLHGRVLGSNHPFTKASMEAVELWEKGG